MEQDYFRILSQTAIADIINRDSQLITIKKSQDVEELLKKLNEYSYTSLPVTESSNSRVIGFVDTNDILTLLIKLFEKIDSSEGSQLTSGGTDDIKLLSIAFLHSSVSNIMDISKKDEFTVVLEEQNLLEVMKLYSRGLHRVALLSVFSDIREIVSQSNVIDFISRNTSLLGRLELMPIQILFDQHVIVTRSQLIETNENLSAITSFRLMNQYRVSACAVVDDHNNITGTLSINDLAGLNENNLDLLLKSTKDFISRDNQLNKNKPSEPIVLSLNNTFKDVIMTLSQKKVHRVWIVDQSKCPISLISLTDVCKIIISPPNY
ncbi:hypothetical protein DLAC_08838 [Tieghemostelium lacteum]|uniref:CBS domain-containing protein n=1 Tax=Tieghemostelium lacteum TaxID=361077 RepID=A0A151Z8E0_TIELA|nr:hypothetical protein DLAC_08838 [Tieghemostelium lacteum]|eukprot:KYQ90236.1 hypothetical protein DLAC_08838 [Tieghemostelium lacteum]